jgi:hypothetical protein
MIIPQNLDNFIFGVLGGKYAPEPKKVSFTLGADREREANEKEKAKEGAGAL